MTKHKILVVEPDEEIRNMLDIYFTHQGYEVKTFGDGKGVFVFIESTPPNILIINGDLPGENSGKIVRHYHSAVHQFAPLIWIKNERPPSRIGGPELASTVDIISKPFDIEELKLRIKFCIEAFERDLSSNND